jgi:hypothetical protein
MPLFFYLKSSSKNNYLPDKFIFIILSNKSIIMETDYTNNDKTKTCSEVKSSWSTPDIIELNVKNTNSNDYYNDDGWGPGASLS